MTDREQVWRDANAMIAIHGKHAKLAHACLALLAELKQTERDEQTLSEANRALQRSAVANRDGRKRAEAKAEKLAWRMRRIKANAEDWHGPPQDIGQERALAVVAEWATRALDEYEQK
jgi:hypothetical protein